MDEDKKMILQKRLAGIDSEFVLLSIADCGIVWDDGGFPVTLCERGADAEK